MNIKDEGFTEKRFEVDKYNKEDLNELIRRYKNLGWEDQGIVRDKNTEKIWKVVTWDHNEKGIDPEYPK